MKGEKRPRVVVAGFGDTGVCCVADLAASADFDLCAVTPKPCHHSAQELGGRIAQPALWEQLYLLPFQEYPKLDNVEIVQGLVTSLDLEAQLVTVKDSNGKHREEAYDVLLISSGVSSGFWRTTKVESRESLLQTIKVEHERIAQAAKVSVVGGGPSGVSAAYAIKRRFPRKEVNLFFTRELVLPGYHERVRRTLQARLKACGVALFPLHRAILPRNFTTAASRTLGGKTTLRFQDGAQASRDADVVIWATGHAAPNTAFVPSEILNERGFVRVDKFLRAQRADGSVYRNVFSVGDVAATDPARTSARNEGWRLVSRNIRAALRRWSADDVDHDYSYSDSELAAYHPATHRWGSILGVWDGEGMELFMQNGISVTITQWLWESLWPGACWYLWGGTRTGVQWDRRVDPDGLSTVKGAAAGAAAAASGWRYLVGGVIGAILVSAVLGVTLK